ncbi:MAG TPA: hypothetical protein VE261_02415 [Gaiellaceae bacterium]|nr:hypothetical protein [Gaiellaceae bacterium]
MRKVLVLATAGALVALAATAPASAKGPSTASLTGPGLDRALPVKGFGEGGTGTPLGSLVMSGGYFPQVFGQTPDPTTRMRPAGDLGPRYRVVYRVPGPTATSTIVQDVYPYAKPRPVTHMPAGQRFWGGMRTKGGWFVSDARLEQVLVRVGLPKSPPVSGGGSFPWTWTAAGAAAVLLLLVALRVRGSTRLGTLRSTA